MTIFVTYVPRDIFAPTLKHGCVNGWVESRLDSQTEYPCVLCAEKVEINALVGKGLRQVVELVREARASGRGFKRMMDRSWSASLRLGDTDGEIIRDIVSAACAEEAAGRRMVLHTKALTAANELLALGVPRANIQHELKVLDGIALEEQLVARVEHLVREAASISGVVNRLSWYEVECVHGLVAAVHNGFDGLRASAFRAWADKLSFEVAADILGAALVNRLGNAFLKVAALDGRAPAWHVFEGNFESYSRGELNEHHFATAIRLAVEGILVALEGRSQANPGYTAGVWCWLYDKFKHLDSHARRLATGELTIEKFKSICL